MFLVALCVSIALEALGRLIAPPEISNPKVIVIVGTLGLLSNVVGLFLFHGRSITVSLLLHSYSLALFFFETLYIAFSCTDDWL